MAEDSELETLARRYLDLWESQLSAMAADSELAEQLGRLFAATNASLLASVKATADSGAGAGDGAQHGTGDANGAGASAGGAAAAAAARGHGAMDMAEFERRLAAVERRLDAIERRQSSSD
jgi:hypothetical protein